jgi:hypothetical protein
VLPLAIIPHSLDLDLEDPSRGRPYLKGNGLEVTDELGIREGAQTVDPGVHDLPCLRCHHFFAHDQTTTKRQAS